jgi:hypothetical protein
MKRTLLTAGLTLACMLLPGPATPAAADGGGGVPIDTTDAGIVDGGSGLRYFATHADGETTLLRIDPAAEPGAKAMKRQQVDGLFQIPAVAFDGTTSGLSADGSTLVVSPLWLVPGQERTKMLLINAERMRVADRIELRGSYTFDAISPDGSRVYLVHYLDPRDPLAYEVRAWDTERARLLREPIVDEREAEAGEDMRGQPMTRVVSPDGRWDLTLYDGGGKKPFVHALNTVDGTAFCVDLDMVSARTVWRASLQPADDFSSVAVVDRSGKQLASISTDDWVATEPGALEPAASGGSATGWWLVLAGVVLLAGAAIVRRLRRRRHEPAEPMPIDPFGGSGPGGQAVHAEPQDKPTSPAAPPSP